MHCIVKTVAAVAIPIGALAAGSTAHAWGDGSGRICYQGQIIVIEDEAAWEQFLRDHPDAFAVDDGNVGTCITVTTTAPPTTATPTTGAPPSTPPATAPPSTGSPTTSTPTPSTGPIPPPDSEPTTPPTSDGSPPSSNPGSTPSTENPSTSSPSDSSTPRSASSTPLVCRVVDGRTVYVTPTEAWVRHLDVVCALPSTGSGIAIQAAAATAAVLAGWLLLLVRRRRTA
jgi:LPXTG-motif cell wall-anchored protein